MSGEMKRQLTDEELIAVAGGRGEFITGNTVFWCEFVADDATFRKYLRRSSGCVYYERIEGYNDFGHCATCKHLHLK